MHLTLNEFLKLNTNNIPNLLLVNTNIENIPISIFALDYLKTILPTSTNINKFNVDRSFDFDKVMQVISSKSLFDEVNYIELNYKTKPTLEHIKVLHEIYPKLSQDNVLVLLTDKLNKRDLATNWVKDIDNNGAVLSLDTDCFATIANHLFSNAYVSIETEALDLLMKINLGNSSQFIQEINNIILGADPNKTLSVTDIKNLTHNNSQFNIYQLSNAYLSGDITSSLQILDNIYQSPEDGILINWILTEDVRKLLKIKARLKTNNNITQIIRDIGIWGDSIKHFPKAVSRLSYNQLLEILELTSELDFIIKGISTNNTRLHIIKILTILCHNGAYVT